MRLFGGSRDDGYGRWDTAVHEAGHVEVARSLGARRLRATVYDAPTRRASGHFTGRFDGSKEQEAVILLAGGTASRRMTGRGRPSGSDLTQAKKLLRASGVSMRDAQREADRLVDRNHRQIDRSARTLHRRGRLG